MHTAFWQNINTGDVRGVKLDSEKNVVGVSGSIEPGTVTTTDLTTLDYTEPDLIGFDATQYQPLEVTTPTI